MICLKSAGMGMGLAGALPAWSSSISSACMLTGQRQERFTCTCMAFSGQAGAAYPFHGQVYLFCREFVGQGDPGYTGFGQAEGFPADFTRGMAIQVLVGMGQAIVPATRLFEVRVVLAFQDCLVGADPLLRGELGGQLPKQLKRHVVGLFKTQAAFAHIQFHLAVFGIFAGKPVH